MPVYSTAAALADRQTTGRRVRQCRQERGWKLADLAARVSTSVGSLSVIENDKASPTIDLLVAISRALDVPLDALLPCRRSRHVCIARRADVERRPPLPMKLVNRMTGSLLSYHNKLRPLADPFVGKHIEPFEIDVEPVPEGRAQLISHHHEEFVFILRGEVECCLKTPEGPVCETLRQGDSVYFWSYLPHSIRSTGSEPAHAVHVLCSLDEPADSELSTDESGPIYLMDASRRNPSGQIGSRIATLRLRRAMSVTEFATHLGVSPRQLARIERGQKSVTVDFLLRVCQRCRKPLEYFLASTFVDRPFCQVIRAREIRRQAHVNGTTTPPASAPHCSAATFVPLVSEFKDPGMRPFLMRLQRPDRPGPLLRHPGQEFLYVLRGGVRVTTVEDDKTFTETLSPGDSCFLDATLPHRFDEAELTPYSRSCAEAIAVCWHPAGETLPPLGG